jgi:predicted HicB family RNase H-like nuclease
VVAVKDFLHYIIDMAKKRMGRPPSDNPKGESLVIRVTPEEKTELGKKAEKAGVSLSQWVRESLIGKERK